MAGKKGINPFAKKGAAPVAKGKAPMPMPKGMPAGMPPDFAKGGAVKKKGC